MNETWLRRTAWVLALLALASLLVSVILILLNQVAQDGRYLELLSGAIVTCGAPILGLVILKQQPRNRIGWLWLFYALAVSFLSLSYSIYYLNHTAGAVPSGLMLVSLLFSESANVIRIICMVLLMLLFPDGQPPSARWRFLYGWTAVAFIMLTSGNFLERVNWTETDGFIGGPGNVNNPLGFIPESLTSLIGILTALGFFSLLAIMILAAMSIIIRYRSAGQQVRAQIQWFVMGGVIFAATFIAAVFLIPSSGDLAGAMGNLAVIPFYLAIGIAITRYRLYDIDLIIRRTLVYAALTLTLALVYFASVLLLQNLFETLTGQGQSPLALVISTLAIAALFNPLRKRIQNDLDRRFFRKKYDAEQTLAAFAAGLRQEVDLEQISRSLLAVTAESMQPESVSLWVKPDGNQSLKPVGGSSNSKLEVITPWVGAKQ